MPAEPTDEAPTPASPGPGQSPAPGKVQGLHLSLRQPGETRGFRLGPATETPGSHLASITQCGPAGRPCQGRYTPRCRGGQQGGTSSHLPSLSPSCHKSTAQCPGHRPSRGPGPSPRSHGGLPAGRPGPLAAVEPLDHPGVALHDGDGGAEPCARLVPAALGRGALGPRAG